MFRPRLEISATSVQRTARSNGSGQVQAQVIARRLPGFAATVSQPWIPILTLLAAFLIFPVLHGQTRSAEDEAAYNTLFEGPILRWEVELPEASLQALRNAPRDYVRGTVRVGGRVFGDVGIHVKGSAGSRRSIDDRPAMTLKFNRYRKGQRGFGCEKLHLNNSVQDPSTLNENLASRLYPTVGIPTTRATHALLRLNGREMGVYVLKEAFDTDFLRRHFPEEASNPGNLYEGGFVGDIDRNLERDAGAGPEDRSDLRRLRAAAQTPLRERRDALNAALDVDRFLTLTAVQMILDDRDGYVRNRNNYRVYFRSSDGRAVFLPHGMDQLLRETEGPIRDAWNSIVAHAVFALPDRRIALRERMRTLLGGPFSEQVLTNTAALLQRRLDPALDELAGSSHDWDELRQAGAGLSRRLQQRLRFVRRELEDWPDPMPAWSRGTRRPLSGWALMIQSGAAAAATNTLAAGGTGALYFQVKRPETRASFRTTVVLPAGSYRLQARCRTENLEAFEDQFGRGATLRTTGSTAPVESRMEGTAGWRSLVFEFDQPEDGSVECMVEVRANRGEAWFDSGNVFIEAR